MVDCVSVLEAPVSAGADVVVSVTDSGGVVEDCVSVLDGPGVVDCISVVVGSVKASDEPDPVVDVSATVVVSVNCSEEVSCNCPSAASVGTADVVKGTVATASDVASDALEDVDSVPTASDVVVPVSGFVEGVDEVAKVANTAVVVNSVVVVSSSATLPVAQTKIEMKTTKA